MLTSLFLTKHFKGGGGVRGQKYIRLCMSALPLMRRRWSVRLGRLCLSGFPVYLLCISDKPAAGSHGNLDSPSITTYLC